MKRVVAIHDLSCHAKSSLTVVLPTLAALQVEASILPTALLSTQTDGFVDYYYEDLTEHMERVLLHWEKLKLTFDGIYSGFLGSEKQIEIVLRLIEDQRALNHPSLVVVDPVLGDHGEPYGPVSPLLIEGMKHLVAQANLITPNTTEAALLLNESYVENLTVLEAAQWAQRLSLLGPRYVAITSVMEKNVGITVAYDKIEDKIFEKRSEYAPLSYPGCGDLFASIVTSLMVNSYPFERAVERSGELVSKAVYLSLEKNIEQRMGIGVELIMEDLGKERQ